MGTTTWTMADGTICRASDEVMASEHSWEKFRACRDSTREMYVDYYQSKPLFYDSLTSGQKSELGAYRQALLDLPATVLAQVGADFVLVSTDQYFPAQPTFMDSHPRGRSHT